jgi:Tfp pilus assembly protein PilV
MELHHTAVKEEAGFSAIEILLSLIIVILITFVGYYVYHTQKAANATYKAVSITANQVAPVGVPKSKALAKDNPSAQSYLVIKEWGVQLILPSAIKDAQYSFSNSKTTSMNSVTLGTASLTKLSANCSPSATSLGAIARQSTAQHDANLRDQASNNENLNNPVYRIKVGDYYYQYIHAQAACYDASNAAAADYYITIKPDQLLKSAVDTLQLVQ